MDTYVGASPVPSMAGQAYFVRIGLVYLALVSEEGKTAFLWSAAKGAEDGSWQPVKAPLDEGVALGRGTDTRPENRPEDRGPALRPSAHRSRRR